MCTENKVRIYSDAPFKGNKIYMWILEHTEFPITLCAVLEIGHRFYIYIYIAT